jgi:hypothetical protein
MGTYSMGYEPPSSDKSGYDVQFCHQTIPPIEELVSATRSAGVLPPYARPRFGEVTDKPDEPLLGLLPLLALPDSATLPEVPELEAPLGPLPLVTPLVETTDPLDPVPMRIASS